MFFVLAGTQYAEHLCHATERQLDWNSFQRENKGKWSRHELNRQWSLYKGQTLGPYATSGTTADSSICRALQVAALKEGITVLTASQQSSDSKAENAQQHVQQQAALQQQHSSGAAGQALSSTAAACDAAVVEVAAVPCKDVASTRGLPIIEDDITCSLNLTPGHHPDKQQLQHQPQQLVNGTSSTSATASSLEAAEGLAGPLIAAAAAAHSAADGSPDSCSDPVNVSSDPSHELQKLREAVHLLLAKHNSNPALQHPQHRHRQQQPGQQMNDDSQLQADVLPNSQQTHTQHNGIGITASAQQPVTQPAAAAVKDMAVGSGCFGLTTGRTKLSWNAFQKACKGRALTKTQISEAYQHAKQHHTLTGQMALDAYLQRQQQQQGPQQLYTQQEIYTQPQVGARGVLRGLQQWLHSAAASRAASRACSTAVSPTSSPARHTAVAASEIQQQQHQQQCHQHVMHEQLLYPRAQAGQGPKYVGGGRGGVGPWAALKEWVSSRSSSRAVSRLGTPAASPGLKCEPSSHTERANGQLQQCSRQQPSRKQQQAGLQQHEGCQGAQQGDLQQGDLQQGDLQQGQVVHSSELQEAGREERRQGVRQQEGCQWAHQKGSQQGQVVQGEGNDAEDAAYMPFAAQRQAFEGQWQPRTHQQQQPQDAVARPEEHSAVRRASTATEAGRAGASAQASLLTACTNSSSSCSASRVSGINSSVQATFGMTSMTCPMSQPAPAYAGRAMLSRPSASTPIVAAAAAAASADSAAAAATPAGFDARIGHRVARECVPDKLAGLLEGFSQWVAAEPAQLKRLKRAVPAQPGLYEWGVRLPRSRGSCMSADAGASRATSSLATSCSTAAWATEAHGPVLAFYLGKAGTLQPQRPRRSATQYGSGSTGETLRTRLNKYCFSKAQKLGPVNEPHKAAFFQQQLEAGGRLFVRWWVCTTIEPVVAETMLLNRLDYALNYLHNNDRRRLII